MTNDIEKVGPSIEQEFQKALEQGIDNGYEEILDSELTFKPKDKIIYFLFEGFCNGLQEITLENYDGDDLDNSEFFLSKGFGDTSSFFFFLYGCFFCNLNLNFMQFLYKVFNSKSRVFLYRVRKSILTLENLSF